MLMERWISTILRLSIWNNKSAIVVIVTDKYLFINQLFVLYCLYKRIGIGVILHKWKREVMDYYHSSLINVILEQ